MLLIFMVRSELCSPILNFKKMERVMEGKREKGKGKRERVEMKIKENVNN